ncbi:MAG TPA: enoyl-CoA hydratase-related protein [Flavitalea sp.]|nr:enoyl-CoA hydratase-related protein [Flavitalea sp.]
MASIEMQIDKNVAHITLNRPEKMNAFNREMSLLFQQRLDDCSKDKSVRAVVIMGSGKAFSAGQDLAEVTDPTGGGMKQILAEQFNPIVHKIRELAKPVVAAVNGVAAGAGANIALCCDIVIASGAASFIQAFSKIGLVPDTGGTFILPRLIGFQKASAIMMLGDKISAMEAERIGMIYKSVEEVNFTTEVERIAGLLSTMPTKGLAYTKQALNAALSNDLTTQLEIEDQLQQRAAATSDFLEGVTAFIEKRTPNFKGE